MTDKVNADKHLLYIDGLRAIFSVYVVMHHVMLTFISPKTLSLQQIFVTPFVFGHYAVNFFIVLSGFCLALPFLKTNYVFKNGIFDFYKRRFFRIYPAYILSLVFSVIIIYAAIHKNTGTLWDLSIPVNFNDIITHVLLIPDLFYSTIYKINYIYWSIAVECRIYILFPVIIFCCRKLGVMLSLLLSFIVSFSIWFSSFHLHHLYNDIEISSAGVHPYLILFIMGIFAADLSLRKTPESEKSRLNWITIMLISVAILLMNMFYNGNTIKDITSGCVAMWILVALNNAATLKLSWLKNALSWGPLAFVGSFAYSIYLFHPIFIQLIWQYIVVPLNLNVFTAYCLTMLAGVPVIVFLCYLLFLVCEKPFMKYKEKIRFNVKLKAIEEPAP
jgi:peptidoglycan/LPS O-acetylase OafA/YrhL